MEIPRELYAHEVIQYLPIEDILTLCKTSLTLQSICQDNATWQFLIGRDYPGEEIPKEKAKERYFYIKYIHDLSDIKQFPSNYYTKKGELDIRKIPRVLRILGYVKNGNVWEPKLMDIERIYNSMMHAIVSRNFHHLGWIPIVSFGHSVINTYLQELLAILPDIFKIVQDRNLYTVGIDIYHLSLIYDFYHGEGVFWNGFLGRIQPYLDSLTLEERRPIQEVVDKYYAMIYPNAPLPTF